MVKWLQDLNTLTLRRERMPAINLTNEQVSAIADRLDVVVGNEFHDAVCTALNDFGWGEFGGEGISDMDVYKIKNELALGYLQEYKDYYDKKHNDEIKN
tara:strand:- start:148 stop:444 length:297 start_codon:yes stop_codon:yes gene_type:complete